MPICSTNRFRAISSPTFLICPTGMGAGVRGLVNGKEALGLDRGVALCRRQAGVTEKLLDRAQITAGIEKVSCKAVPQRMRGRCLRQIEKTAQRRHLPLHQARIERAASSPDKQRPLPT